MRIGRYAPSPTGGLHLGNLLAAVCANAWTRRGDDDAIVKLRIEDLDRPRCPPTATTTIVAELEAMGLRYDVGPHAPDSFGPYIQSESAPHYDAALETLRQQGHLFACECTRKDLAAVASAPHAGDEPPRYAGTCREKDLPFDDPERPVAWRFEPAPGEVHFDDAFCGDVVEDVSECVGPFIVRRKDGVVAYHLACVVDDARQQINEVVRGRDLLTSTPRQIALQRALQLPTPAYAHGPLLVDESGGRLAKRRGDQTISALLKHQSAGEILGRIGAALGVCMSGESIDVERLSGRLDRSHFQPAQLSLPAAPHF